MRSHASFWWRLVLQTRLQQQLPALAGGEGVLESAFDHYRPIRGTFPTRPRSDQNPLDRKEYLLHVLARFARQLRESRSIDQRSGVSARFVTPLVSRWKGAARRVAFLGSAIASTVTGVTAWSVLQAGSPVHGVLFVHRASGLSLTYTIDARGVDSAGSPVEDGADGQEIGEHDP